MPKIFLLLKNLFFMLFKTIQKIRKNFLGLAVGCLAVVGVTGCQENLQDAVQPQKSRTELTHETEEFKFVRTPTGDVLNTIDTVIFPTLLEDAAKKHGKGLAQKLLNTYDAHTGKMTLQAAKSKEFIEWKNAQKVQANYSITYGARLEGAGTFGYAGAWGAPVGSTHQSKAMFGFAFAINPYRIPAPFTYGMHVSIIGDVTVNCYETVDYNRRIEGFWINNDIITSGFATNVYYQGHLQDRGWDLNITTVPGFIGTRGESRRLEAIKIWLVVL
jgi:hypothetical protein